MSLNKTGTRVEFHRQGEKKNLVSLSGVGGIPNKGDLVNIRGETWRVLTVTWAVDQSDKIGETELRANIALVKP